jgi:transposase
VTTKLTRLRGRSPCGARLEADAPFGHWRTQTFIAGLRVDELTAPWLLDGPMNRAAFDVYIETQLAPTLQPGDVVIADNLSSHKSAWAQALLKAQGNWMLFLPPYSPDLNPPLSDCLAITCRSADRDGLLQAQSPPAKDGRQNI